MAIFLDNLDRLLKEKGISIRSLEQSIGCSNGVISRGIKKGTDISSQWVSKIIETFSDINPSWLLTGQGNMYKSPDLATNHATSNARTLAPFIGDQTTTIGIPLVSEMAVGGLSGSHFSIQESDILGRYNIPKFRNSDADFLIEVRGDSMTPIISAGDIIACSILRDSKFIQWNKIHLISTTEQGLIVKRLRRSSDPKCLLAVSDNPDYEPFDIPKDEIVGMARVIGSVHFE